MLLTLHRLQENFDDRSDGRSHQSIECHLFGNLVNQVNPGDVIRVSGIIKVDPLPGTSHLLHILKGKSRLDPSASFVLEANNIEKMSQYNTPSLKNSRLEAVTSKLRNSASIVEALTGSFCGKIVGNFPAKCTAKYHEKLV